MNKDYYDYDFLIDLEKNNENILNVLKKNDYETYKLLEKTKINVLFLSLKKNYPMADKLCKQYRKVLIKAYGYFTNKSN
jgi:hypothetical protein